MARQRLTESEAISQFLTSAFQSPDPARDGRTITVAEMLDTAAKKLDTDLADQPARRASLQATLGTPTMPSASSAKPSRCKRRSWITTVPPPARSTPTRSRR